jgi:hypothetical protein
VARKTSACGRSRHLMPKAAHERGKAGSQLALK